MAFSYPAALLLPVDAYDIDRHQVMGRRVAGLQLAKALVANLQVDESLTLIGTNPTDLRALAADLPLPKNSQLVLSTRLDPRALEKLGCLHVPDPGLSNWCELRSSQRGHAWSLSGVIHTVCSQTVSKALEELLTAPLYSWDALICTSKAGLQVVEAAINGHHEALERRFNSKLTMPEGPLLPLIPLALDPAPYCWKEHFASRNEQRLWARKQLGISADALVVVFVGRLSFHSKAHPQPLYRALAKLAANQTQEVLLLECGHIYNSFIAAAFDDLAIEHDPLKVQRLGGLEPASDTEKQLALAAADLFCSLADNLQETFGLSVLEAMAAELPVVASDWSGYRDLVEPGVSGFLIASADALKEASVDQLEREYRLGLIDYDKMVGLRSLAVSIDPAALFQALAMLQQRPLLRLTMGLAARQRLEQLFSAEVVASQYRALWQQLKELRQKAAIDQPQLQPAAVRVPYGRLFAGFASSTMGTGPWQRLRNSTPASVLLSPMQVAFCNYWCADSLAPLVQWLETIPINKQFSLNDLFSKFNSFNISAEHQKPLLACLIKLEIIKSTEPDSVELKNQ